MYRNARRFTIETTTQVLICVVQCVFESTVDLFHLSSACVEEVMNIAKNLRDKSLSYDWRAWLVLPISRELDIPLK